MAQVQLKCAGCGSDQFSYPREKLDPEDEVTCLGCGRGAQYKELAAQLLAKYEELAAEEFRKALGATNKRK
jgi:hypothetical protein